LCIRMCEMEWECALSLSLSLFANRFSLCFFCDACVFPAALGAGTAEAVLIHTPMDRLKVAQTGLWCICVFYLCMLPPPFLHLLCLSLARVPLGVFHCVCMRMCMCIQTLRQNEIGLATAKQRYKGMSGTCSSLAFWTCTCSASRYLSETSAPAHSSSVCVSICARVHVCCVGICVLFPLSVGVRLVLRDQGVAGLFKGLSACWLRQGMHV
jgi:hypothetical protein